ncbi:MAG TPA: MFS transporter [Candidatus Dormibacteraeota bacterium]
MVGAGFFSMALVFGVAYSFGAFFAPMAAEFHAGSGATSVIFSVTAFLWFTLGVVSGWAGDRFGTKRVMAVGAVVMGTGLVLTSFVHQLWLGYLTYGIGVGVGTACGYVPMVAAVGSWFDRRQGLALGIAISGIGVGTLAGAPAATALIGLYGWRQTYLIFGIVSFLVLAACGFLADRPAPTSVTPPDLGGTLRTREFMTLYLSILLTSFGLFTFFVHLVPYAESKGIAPLSAASLLAVVGVFSTLGRLALGPVADRFGRLRTLQLAIFAMAASYLIWLSEPGYAGLAVFAAIMGAAYGGWVAISPSVLAELFGTEGLGGTAGALYTGAGIGALLGPPVAGYVVDATGSYRPAIVGAMVLEVAALAVILTLKPRRLSG